MPRVSVVMSVRNEAAHVEQAVQSILSQTYSDFEFLVVDDASDDATPEILESFGDPRLQVVRNDRNLGASDSCNAAMDRAVGEFVVRMDGDDVSYPDRIKRQVAFMEERPDVGVAGAGMRVLGPGPLVRFSRPPQKADEVRAALFFRCVIAQPTVILRPSFLARHSLRYDSKLFRVEDYDLWKRCSEHFPCVNMPDTLVDYRVTLRHFKGLLFRSVSPYSELIGRRHLEELGVQFSERELWSHLRYRHWPHLLGYSVHISWVEKLIKANRRAGMYPEPEFSREVERFFTGRARRSKMWGGRKPHLKVEHKTISDTDAGLSL